VLLVLFMPDDEVVFRNAAGAELAGNAHRFVSRLAAARFLGYLRAQKTTMTGATRVVTDHAPPGGLAADSQSSREGNPISIGCDHLVNLDNGV